MTKWTEAQEKAIYEPSGKGNILVSAAAGSGKTAVLVERIANMIMRDEDRVSVDELLVATFTEAAAEEMKERIIKRINTAYHEEMDKGNTAKARYLKEQMYLTSSADINTIDSFCLSVVKNNFHVLGIDPNFSIMDNNEMNMLMDDTLSDLFLELYALEDEEERERFISLVNVYASNRDDEGLKNIVRKIYNFMQTFPDPAKWLIEKADMYSEDMTESGWVKDVFIAERRNYIVKKHEKFWDGLSARMLNIVKAKYNIDVDTYISYEEIKEAVTYWGKIWSNVCKCREAIKVLKSVDSYDDMCKFYKTYIDKKTSLGSAINKPPKNKEASDEEWQLFYNEYNYVRDVLREQCIKFPADTKDGFNEYVHSKELKRNVDNLVWLTQKFSDRFEENKNKKNEKSFSDIEHLAYRLFCENENIREEYSQRYKEILIDEYQDTNGLQDAIFTAISRDNKNIFMVGDLKQSIYAFRGGDPMIFKEKNRLYEDTDEGKKISLSQNFRSRQEVLKSINAVFGKTMSDEVGDVYYVGDEILQRDEDRECYADGDNLTNEENIKSGYNSELYRIAVLKEDEETEEDVTAQRAEASCIARRIRSLVDGHFKIHAGDGQYRDIEYRDIVVLMRSIKRSGDILREIMENYKIPTFVQKEEYFERREIKLILSLISLINNHMQDIPLVAVMRSPIGGFTENELAKIRIGSYSKSFYKTVKGYKVGETELTEEESKLRSKCRRFINDLDRWRGYVKMKSIASLIWTLYEETGFYDFMGALEGGEEAQANLKLLYERAKRYEESGFKGIFNFIRYIESMEKRNDDVNGAKLVNENHNVVRIMTIHKSKGLEFPVVFLANTEKKFAVNFPGEENRVRLHKDFGIGVDYYNYENMYCKKLMFNEFIKNKNSEEQRSEEIRLMYVAMTRAKEKLIVTGAKSYKDEETYYDKTDEIKNQASSDFALAQNAENAKCYSDWITPSVINGAECWVNYELKVPSIKYETEEKVEKEEIVIENPDEMRDGIKRILEFKYEYPQSGNIPAKTSVTAIKEMEDEEHKREDDTVYMVQKPMFMQGKKSGAQIGTAHHQVMAYIDITAMSKIAEDEYEEFVKNEIMRIANDGQIEREMADDKKIADTICANVCGFFKSDMGKSLFKAKHIYRERPFEIEITAQEYDESLPDEYKAEKVVVQGIIDLYFEDENGDIILVDYKTDSCKTHEEQMRVADRYSRQLELYRQAMEKILKKSVKDKYLYLFSAQSVVKLD